MDFGLLVCGNLQTESVECCTRCVDAVPVDYDWYRKRKLAVIIRISDTVARKNDF